MKKLIALVLALVLMVFAAGCAGGFGNNGNPSEVSSEIPFTTVDIMNYTSVGRFPEFNLGLGCIMGDVRAEYQGDGKMPEYKAVSGMHTLAVDSSTYFMTKADYKVVAIITQKSVFGFNVEVTPENLTAHLGEPTSSFIPDTSKLNPYGTATGETLANSYVSGENTVVFYFLQGKLHSTLIYKTGSFSLIGA